MARTEKAESKPKGELITNLQKHGLLRFHGKPVMGMPGDMVEIKPGETKLVPWEIWRRYMDRDDVKKSDRVTMAIGGLRDGEQIVHPTAKQAQLKAQEEKLAKQRADLEARAADLEAREQALAERLGDG